MPDQTSALSLPLILPSQAQKHVTHNEALRILDAVVPPSVKSRSLTDPPAARVLRSIAQWARFCLANIRRQVTARLLSAVSGAPGALRVTATGGLF